MIDFILAGERPVKVKNKRRKHTKNRWHKTGTYLPKAIAGEIQRLFNDDDKEYSRAIKLMTRIINNYNNKKMSFDTPLPIPRNYVKKIVSGHAMNIWTRIKDEGILIKVNNHSTAKHESAEYIFNPDFDLSEKVKVNYFTTQKPLIPILKKVKDTFESISIDLPTDLESFIDNRIPIIEASVNKKIVGDIYHASNRKKIKIKGDREEFLKKQVALNELLQSNQLQAFLDKQWRVSRNETNNRIDTNLTNLHGHFKEYLRIDGQVPSFIDLRNSQFTIFANILLDALSKKKTDSNYLELDLVKLFYRESKMCTLSKDIEEFCDLCISGGIYYELAKLLDLKDEEGKIDVGQGKKMAFMLFFDAPNDYKSSRIIEKRFPNVINLINHFKHKCMDLEIEEYFANREKYNLKHIIEYRDKKFKSWKEFWRKKGSSKFSIMLQQVETYIFIDEIYFVLMETHKLYSIHDSFMYLGDETKDMIIDRLNKNLPYGYIYHE